MCDKHSPATLKPVDSQAVKGTSCYSGKAEAGVEQGPISEDLILIPIDHTGQHFAEEVDSGLPPDLSNMLLEQRLLATTSELRRVSFLKGGSLKGDDRGARRECGDIYRTNRI